MSTRKAYAARPANRDLARRLRSPDGITVTELAKLRGIELHSAAANISLFRKHTGARTVRAREPGRRGLVYRMAKGRTPAAQATAFERLVRAAVQRCVSEVVTLHRRHV